MLPTVGNSKGSPTTGEVGTIATVVLVVVEAVVGSNIHGSSC